jgi:hypothetical protein
VAVAVNAVAVSVVALVVIVVRVVNAAKVNTVKLRCKPKPALKMCLHQRLHRNPSSSIFQNLCKRLNHASGNRQRQLLLLKKLSARVAGGASAVEP